MTIPLVVKQAAFAVPVGRVEIAGQFATGPMGMIVKFVADCAWAIP
jgi:hypothetical protein